MKRNAIKITYEGLAVAYIRVSTEEQGHARNGLEAQKSDIVDFCARNRLTLCEEKPFYEEVASGKLDVEKRPALAAALEFVRKHKGAIMVVARIDRLARDSHVITGIMRDRDVKFCSVDHGLDADPFILRLFANLAEKEREMISARTKAALSQLKLKYEAEGLGRRLGTPYISDKHPSFTLKKEADEFAFKIYTEFIQPNKLENKSIAEIVRQLTKSEFKPQRSNKWNMSTVQNLVPRGEQMWRESIKPKRGRPRKL